MQTPGEDVGPLFEKPIFDPNNKQWANDQTGFGFRMLQKMGWTPGKGLGQKEDGRLTNVTLEFKDNNLGIGIKAHQADKFEKQQQEFSDTLKSIGNLFERKNLEQKQLTIVQETMTVTTTSVERRDSDQSKERRKDKQDRKERRQKEKQEKRERRARRKAEASGGAAQPANEEETPTVPKKTHSHYIPNRVIHGKSVSRYSKEDLAQIFQSVPLDEPVKTLEPDHAHSRVDVKIDDSFCKIAQFDSKEYFKAKLGRPEPPKHELVYVPSKKQQESAIEMSVEAAIVTVSSPVDNGDDLNQNKRKRRDEKKAKKDNLKKQKLGV